MISALQAKSNVDYYYRSDERKELEKVLIEIEARSQNGIAYLPTDHLSLWVIKELSSLGFVVKTNPGHDTYNWDICWGFPGVAPSKRQLRSVAT